MAIRYLSNRGAGIPQNHNTQHTSCKRFIGDGRAQNDCLRVELEISTDQDVMAGFMGRGMEHAHRENTSKTGMGKMCHIDY